MNETIVNFATFASSNWTESPVRFKQQLEEIDSKFHFFKKSMMFNENNLGKEYNDRFSKYFYIDHGFAYFSWKPMVLLKALEQIENGELLFYIDGGCTFPMSRIEDFISMFSSFCSDFSNSNCLFGLTSFNERPWYQFPGFPNITIVKKEILEKFDLQDNVEFLYYYPHWQAGLVLCRKDEKTIAFLKEWYQFFLENYETCIRGEYRDRTGQNKMFIQNGSDQAVMQCILFTKKIDVYSMDFIHNFNMIQHLRK